MPSGLLEQLEDTKWKERLEACAKFKEVGTIMMMCEIRIVSAKFKEIVNFQFPCC